jgi:hypothetical protein
MDDHHRHNLSGRGKSRCLSASQRCLVTGHADPDFERSEDNASSTILAAQRLDLKASVAIVTGNVKRRGSALPGVDEENPAALLDCRLVRVSGNYGGEACGGRVEIELARL